LKKDVVTRPFIPKKRYILVENNSTGQFGKLLQMETGISIDEKVLKYDGRPFYPEEIVEYVRNS
jgi:2-oxoglutarate ferredoxin oxidoreductase subunit alpha